MVFSNFTMFFFSLSPSRYGSTEWNSIFFKPRELCSLFHQVPHPKTSQQHNFIWPLLSSSFSAVNFHSAQTVIKFLISPINVIAVLPLRVWLGPSVRGPPMTIFLWAAKANISHVSGGRGGLQLNKSLPSSPSLYTLVGTTYHGALVGIFGIFFFLCANK